MRYNFNISAVLEFLTSAYHLCLSAQNFRLAADGCEWKQQWVLGLEGSANKEQNAQTAMNKIASLKEERCEVSSLNNSYQNSQAGELEIPCLFCKIIQFLEEINQKNSPPLRGCCSALLCASTTEALHTWLAFVKVIVSIKVIGREVKWNKLI